MQEDSCGFAVDWFLHELSAKSSQCYKVDSVGGQVGDLGSLYGVQFNSLQKGGYVYCWSNGYVGYELVDYVSGEQLVDDCLEEVQDIEAMKEKILFLLSHL